MIKLLHVIHGLRPGGLENGVVNLVNYLPEGSFTQAICCLEEKGEMTDRIKSGVEIFEVNRRTNDLYAIFRLAKVFRQWKPDIVHCRNWNSWFDTVIACLIGYPRAIRVWSFHGFAEGGDFPWRRRFISRILAFFTHNLAAVCLDSAERYSMATGINLDRFSILYNGVDNKRFMAVENKQFLRRRLALPQNAIIITTVASLTPIKEHTTLLKVISQVVDISNDNLLFLWVGDGPLRNSLIDKIRHLQLEKSVKLVRNVDNVFEYLGASDLFILPSRLEGMSNAILEAMSAGLPVIANNVGGNKELVENNETGLLCQFGDSHSMAKAISELIENSKLRRYQGEKGIQRVETEFSMESMIQRYMKFYTEIVS